MHSYKNIGAAIAAILTGFSATTFAQNRNNIQQPASPVAPVAPVQPVQPMTGLQMPQMPSISSQPSSSRLYTPGQKSTAAKTQTSASTASSTAPETKTVTQTAKPALPADIGQLTAADLASLQQQGSFTSLTNLLGGNLSGTDANRNQNAVLSQILVELNEIKAAQKNLIVDDPSKSRPSSEPPAIRRFVINNYDILRNCNAVYFSTPENDGSFLLTGDCKMLYNNQTLAETFYMFFKSKGTENGHQVYDVEVSVSQSSKFTGSKLYLFSQQKDLIAQKTGNLVTLRSVQNNVSTDMLLDIGK